MENNPTIINRAANEAHLAIHYGLLHRLAGDRFRFTVGTSQYDVGRDAGAWIYSARHGYHGTEFRRFEIVNPADVAVLDGLVAR